MDSDRELLAAAANANGGKWRWVTCPVFAGKVPGFASLDTVNGTTYWPGWNPLEDDGDALRLAVKLGLSILPTPEDVEVIADQHAREIDGESVSPWACESWTLTQQDPYAATRRAIVRAAAELGRRG